MQSGKSVLTDESSHVQFIDILGHQWHGWSEVRHDCCTKDNENSDFVQLLKVSNGTALLRLTLARESYLK